MSQSDPAAGFSETTWKTVQTFSGRIAVNADVEAGAAVFALGETFNATAFEEPLPQPVIWYDETLDEEFAALIVQAENHETEDGEALQVLGVLMPDGRTAVTFTEDVEEVSGDDPGWLALLAADLAPDELDAEDGDDAVS